MFRSHPRHQLRFIIFMTSRESTVEHLGIEIEHLGI